MAGRSLRLLAPLALLVLLTFLTLLAPGTGFAGGWRRFQDPTEAAFSLEVPEGWSVEGGLKRRSLNQPHPVVAVLSPDGLTTIVLGDPAAIAYGELTNSLRTLGFHEGQSYTPRGEPELIRSYRSGEQWSAERGRSELARHECGNITVVHQRSLPKQPGLPTPAGVERRDTAGETLFTCVRHNILYAAYSFAETSGDYYYQNGQVIAGVWTDDTCVLVLAPQGLGDWAMGIARHMLGSLRWDEAWWQRQFNATVEQANVIYRQATHAIAQQGADWDRAIRGVETYTNPKTGKKLEVSITGADNYAQDDAANVVGIVGSEPPPGFTLLEKKKP
jgi:hypothetical protein